MAHPRALIRAAIVSRLRTTPEVSRAGGAVVHVEDHRVTALPETRLPLVCVYFDGETVAQDVQEPREEVRTLALRVACHARGESATDARDQLDLIADGVERAVLIDETHGDLANQTEIESTDFAEQDESEQVIASCEIRFRVTYRRDYQPLVLAAAEGADIQWDLPSETDNQIEAEDTLDLPQT